MASRKGKRMTTKIEWATDTWNPVTGCTKISDGCRNCYAERMAKRLAGRCGYPADEPFRVTFHPDRLGQPLRWKKRRLVFVCSMGDLFHPAVKYEWIDKIFDVVVASPQHRFLFLTKRPFTMADYIEKFLTKVKAFDVDFWMQNIWLGVTTENQGMAAARIPVMLSIPAAVHFVSLEPLLGPINLKKNILQGLDWIICGGESGPGARPIHPEWVRKIRDDCLQAKKPFFFKQWGDKPDPAAFDEPHGLINARMEIPKRGHILDGEVWQEYPENIS